MSSTSTPESQCPRSLGWLVCGSFFLVVYVITSVQLDLFQIRNLSYCERNLWNDLPLSMMRYFDAQQLSSMIWKVAGLLPATLCLSVFFVRRLGEQLDAPIAAVIQLFSGRRGIILFTVFSAVVIVLLVFFVFQTRPIVDDEATYLFQAKTYLTGNIVLPPPPVPKAIETTFMIVNPVWAGKYLFGHPAVLAIGMALGSPYVASTVMAVACVVLLYLVGVKVTSRSEAILAAGLLALSPFFWFTSATLLSHVSMLFLLLLFLLGWFRLDAKPCFFVALGAGFCLGWAFSVRPLTAILFGIPFAFLTLLNVRREPRKWASSAVGLLTGGLVVFGMILWYNHLVTGNALLFPFEYYDPSEGMGFGGLLKHTPFKGVSNLAVSVLRYNSWFLGWPISFLPLLGLLLVRSAHKCSETSGCAPSQIPAWTTSDKLWLAVVASVCAGNILYYSPGVSDVGPIYYYELLIPLCFLSAKGITTLYHEASLRDLPQVRRFISVFIALSTVGNLVFFLPEKAMHIHRLCESAAAPFELARSMIEDKALVFMSGKRPYYGWLFGLPYPSPRLDDKVLFLAQKEQETNIEAIKAFPDRTPYMLTYDPKKHLYLITRLHVEKEPGKSQPETR